MKQEVMSADHWGDVLDKNTRGSFQNTRIGLAILRFMHSNGLGIPIETAFQFSDWLGNGGPHSQYWANSFKQLFVGIDWRGVSCSLMQVERLMRASPFQAMRFFLYPTVVKVLETTGHNILFATTDSAGPHQNGAYQRYRDKFQNTLAEVLPEAADIGGAGKTNQATKAWRRALALRLIQFTQGNYDEVVLEREVPDTLAAELFFLIEDFGLERTMDTSVPVMALDGEMVMHTDAIADAEWLCLRARVTPCHLWQPPHVVARTVATAAWKRMRYDADVEDDDGNRFSFRPSEEQLRAAARVGIALCGRPPQHRGVDHGLLVVDVGIAPNRLGMVVAGNHVPARATLHKAVDAIGYMFSQLELDRAHDSVDSPSNQCHFLDPCEEAEPAAWMPEPQREDAGPTEPPAVAPSVGCVLESVPETIITAHEAFEHTLTTALVLPTTPYDDVAMPKSEFPEADATSKALSAALAVTIRESPRAFDDLATQINTRAQPGYLAAMADYDSDALAQRAAAVALAPSVEMYRMLDHQGERAIDVAASLLGLKDLEPVVMTEPETVDEPDSLDGSYPGSGTPSSEELEELV